MKKLCLLSIIILCMSIFESHACGIPKFVKASPEELKSTNIDNKNEIYNSALTYEEKQQIRLRQRIETVNKYLKTTALEQIVNAEINLSVKSGHDPVTLVFKNSTIELTSLQKEALIKLHNMAAYAYSYPKDEEKIGQAIGSEPYTIINFLVNYAITHQDEKLMKTILFGSDISCGDGAYAEYVDETQYLPFFLYYPNIDRYLQNEKELNRAADIITGIIEKYNDIKQYNQTLIIPEGDEEKQYEYVLLKAMLDKQSPRLGKDVDYIYMNLVLKKAKLKKEENDSVSFLPNSNYLMTLKATCENCFMNQINIFLYEKKQFQEVFTKTYSKDCYITHTGWEMWETDKAIYIDVGCNDNIVKEKIQLVDKKWVVTKR